MTTLPPALCGRYKRYKDDTSIFATWLRNAATTCGYNSTEHQQQSSFKKATTFPTKITSPVRTLLAQADFIAQSSREISLPEYVYKAAQRAIEARNELNTHFGLLGLNDKINKSHHFFIGVLTEAVAAVKPRYFLKTTRSMQSTKADWVA